MPPQKYNKLAGKHVLIIGGTSGIGFAVAEASIESDARVTISSSSSSKVAAAVASLKKSYPSATVEGHPCDLSKPTVEDEVKELFRKVRNVDHIITTAGDRHAIGKVDDITYESILAAGQIRFIAPLLIAKVGSRYLAKSPDSSIIMTTGSVSVKPRPDWTVLGGFASGMHGMTRGLALDLKPIRVNLVSPGPLDTELWSHFTEEKRKAFYDGVANTMPTGRIAGPEEVAECYLWLMKDRNVIGFVAQSDSGLTLV